jgi:phage terminase small subunit
MNTRGTDRTVRPLTAKQRRFVAEYVTDFNATRAARAAGFSPKCARAEGCRLLRNFNVRAAVDAPLAESLAMAKLEAQRVDEELAQLCFVDIRVFYDGAGRLLPVAAWPPGAAAAVASIETVERNANGGTVIVTKLRLYDKVSALTLAARRLGMLRDQVKLSGTLTLEQLVAASYDPPKEKQGGSK